VNARLLNNLNYIPRNTWENSFKVSVDFQQTIFAYRIYTSKFQFGMVP